MIYFGQLGFELLSP